MNRHPLDFPPRKRPAGLAAWMYDKFAPVAVTMFPGEIYLVTKSWAERAYPSLDYFNEVDKGGHFAAWEEPTLFAAELRAAFHPLR